MTLAHSPEPAHSESSKCLSDPGAVGFMHMAPISLPCPQPCLEVLTVFSQSMPHPSEAKQLAAFLGRHSGISTLCKVAILEDKTFEREVEGKHLVSPCHNNVRSAKLFHSSLPYL